MKREETERQTRCGPQWEGGGKKPEENKTHHHLEKERKLRGKGGADGKSKNRKRKLWVNTKSNKEPKMLPKKKATAAELQYSGLDEQYARKKS